jgi:hypothetical protein
MIHKYNIGDLSLVDRPIGGAKQGFGATLPRHDANHERRYFETENRTFYGKGSAPVVKQAHRAGTNVRPFEL